MLLGRKGVGIEGERSPIADQGHSFPIQVNISIPVSTVKELSFKVFKSGYVWPLPVVEIAAGVDQYIALIIEALT